MGNEKIKKKNIPMAHEMSLTSRGPCIQVSHHCPFFCCQLIVATHDHRLLVSYLNSNKKFKVVSDGK